MNDLYHLVESIPVDTLDTPDQVVYQLANINYRLDILITIALFVVLLCISAGVCYIIYRFFLRFIP